MIVKIWSRLGPKLMNLIQKKILSSTKPIPESRPGYTTKAPNEGGTWGVE
jgi:hypothetical protein